MEQLSCPVAFFLYLTSKNILFNFDFEIDLFSRIFLCFYSFTVNEAMEK